MDSLSEGINGFTISSGPSLTEIVNDLMKRVLALEKKLSKK